MSMHTQLLRGLMTLPVAGMLLVAGLLADPSAPRVPEPGAAQAEATATASSLPRVDFHSMIPGALHIVHRVKLEG